MKVICINAKVIKLPTHTATATGLVEGKVYTVTEECVGLSNREAYRLAELCGGIYLKLRFRPFITDYKEELQLSLVNETEVTLN